MRFAGLAFVLLTAVASAAPAAWGQNGGEKLRESYKKLDAEAPDKLLDAGDAAALKKSLALCKKTGDCKAYLLEKKKANINKDKEEIPAVEAAPTPAPGAPSGAPMAVEGDAAPLPGASAPTAAQAETMSRDAGARRERTMSRAAGAVDSMRRSFFPAEESAPRKDGAPERRPAAAPAPAGAQTVPELALAARTGYAETFRAQGLKVGPGPRGEPAIQRADGSPASPADLDRLRTALRAEPAALARRPDFFRVLPREKFADLKKDYEARPELRASAFKDVGMTAAARDFQWSASCSGLSGSCNPHSGQGSYRKGQDVPPEDLDSIWKAAQEEILPDDEDFGEYTEEDRRLAAAEDLAAEKLGAGRRGSPTLIALLARMGELARGGGEPDAGAPASAVPAPVANDRLPAAQGGSPGPVARAAVSSSAAPRRSGPPPAPEERRAADVRTGAFVLAAAAAALLALGLRRKG